MDPRDTKSTRSKNLLRFWHKIKKNTLGGSFFQFWGKNTAFLSMLYVNVERFILVQSTRNIHDINTSRVLSQEMCSWLRKTRHKVLLIVKVQENNKNLYPRNILCRQFLNLRLSYQISSARNITLWIFLVFCNHFYFCTEVFMYRAYKI